MPAKKKPTSGDDARDPDASPKGRQSEQTVRVEKGLVKLARKTAMLKNVSQEEFIAPILESCITHIEDAVRKSGPIVVGQQAETNEHVKEVSTFTTTPEIATRLASLAGQCLTSVARLVHPWLHRTLWDEFTWAVREEAGWFNIPVIAPQNLIPGTAGLSEGEIEAGQPLNTRHAFGGPDVFMVRWVDDTLTGAHVVRGDLLVIRRGGDPAPGQTVALLADDELSLYRVKEAADRKSGEVVKRLVPYAGGPGGKNLADAGRLVVGVLTAILREETNPGERTARRSMFEPGDPTRPAPSPRRPPS
ncbi:MAG TPA: hypothetical protein VD866_24945 [Urbifossiella sp.]|nr:hypothetical protein [Urbifossiella sp.]